MEHAPEKASDRKAAVGALQSEAGGGQQDMLVINLGLENQGK